MKAALTLGDGTRRFRSYLDYNHDPRLDNQFAIKQCAMEGKCILLERIILVPFVDYAYAFRMAAANDKLDLMNRVMKCREAIGMPDTLQNLFVLYICE
jgi:hypothetical protein